MAMLLLPLAGAMMAPAGYAAVGWAIGSMAATLLFPQKMPGQEGPRVSDLKIQSSAEGGGIPQVFGTMRLAGNVIDAADLREVKKTEEVGGGKGGGGADVTTYSYYGTWAIGLCEGPAAGIRRIWADHKLIYDASPGGGGEVDAVRGRIKIYNGSSTQMPDPALEALHGAGNVPAYRGLCYVVFSDVLLSDWGNRIPNITAEVVMAGVSGTTVTPLAHPTVEGSCYDSNRHVMYVTSPGLWRVTMDGVYEPIIIQSDSLSITLVADNNGNSIIYDPVNDCIYTTAWNNLNDEYMILRVDPETGWITGAHNTGVNLCHSFALDDVNDKLWAKVRNAPYLYGESDILYIRRGEYHLSPPHLISIGDVQFSGSDTSRIAFDNSTNTLLVAWYNTAPDPDVVTYYGVNGSDNESYDTYVRWQFTLADGLKGAVSDDDGYFYAVTSANKIVKINSQTGARSTLFNGVGAAMYAISLDTTKQNLLVSHTNWGVNYYGITVISATTGAQVEAYSLNGSAYVGMATLQAWDESSLGAIRHPYGTVYKDRLTADSTSVAAVISAIAQKAPLSAADLDVSALVNVPVLGYIRPDIMSPRDALASLLTAFFVDCVETGDKLKFTQRGADSVAAISYQDTAATNGSAADTSILDVTLAQEHELPREVAVRFTDRNNEYDVGLARAQRQLTASVSVSQAEFPIALTHDSAQQIADVLMATAWTQSRAYKFSLDYGYLKLEPGDPVTLTLEDGRVLSALLTKSEYDMLYGTVQCEAVAYDKYLYKAVSQADDYQAVTIALTTGVKLQLIEPPALVDADLSTPVMYALAAPYAGAWRGAALYKSTDDLNYTRVGEFPAQGAQGLALTTLASGVTTVWDTTNTLRVRLFGGSTLSSNTEAAVLNGSNAAWVGDEVVQWQTATLEADGSYTLSNLLRGRLGTEHAVGTHAAGEAFVLLSTGSVLRVPVEISELSLTRYYKAVPYGLSLSSAVKRTVACSGANLKPYAPVNVAGSRDGSGNLTATWVRRARLGGDLLDYVDTPLNEQYEQYQVDVMNGETVVRTFTVTTESAYYSAADQVADFGSNQASVAIRVYQMSAVVGRGHAAAATV